MTSGETTEDIAEVRSTAPQSPFTAREVLIGFVILLIGLVIVAGIPFFGSF